MSHPSAVVHRGDCLRVLGRLPAASVDAVVTDPPAGIKFMGKKWDNDKGGRRQWIAWLTERMAEALRVLKPGGYALVWALPRTSHWTATALEDAGFEIRDTVAHVFGQGFPKSKALLKPAREDWILVRKPGPLLHLRIDECRVAGVNPSVARRETARRTGTVPINGKTAAESNAEGRMNRRGSAEVYLKERPAENAGRWPANIALSHAPGCVETGTRQVRSDGHHPARRGAAGLWSGDGGGLNGTEGEERYTGAGGTEEVASYRCVPGCPVALLDAQSGVRKSGGYPPEGGQRSHVATYGKPTERGAPAFGASEGTASRFFHCFEADPFVYQAKASRRDRGAGNTHPTVKSVALMRHLVRLIAAPGDLVLDPFAGSGSTGVACMREGVRFVGIEQDAESVAIARARLRAESLLPAPKAPARRKSLPASAAQATEAP